jgi:hypothetical protein
MRTLRALLNPAHRFLHGAVLLMRKDCARLLCRHLCRRPWPLHALHLLDASLDGFGLLLQVLNALLRRIELLQLLQALLLRGGRLLEQLHAPLRGVRRLLRVLLGRSGLLRLIHALLRIVPVAVVRQHFDVWPPPSVIRVCCGNGQSANRCYVSSAKNFV